MQLSTRLSRLKIPCNGVSPKTTFGRHGGWKKYLATKILAKVANWRPTDLKRNLPVKLSK